MKDKKVLLMDGISTLIKTQRYIGYYRCTCIDVYFLQVLFKSDIDMFGSQNPPSCPSILISVSARHGPNTMDEINYSVPLRGIKSDNMKIYIIRSVRHGKK